MRKIAFIFGTRPEAIKLCPLIKKIRILKGHKVNVCVTGQHREMLDQVLSLFAVSPDSDLNLMTHDQSLAGLTAKAIEAIDQYLLKEKPDMVIVQGDTTTAFCATLCAFYHKIPVGHVEAGLRTQKKYSPFPEEINRAMTSHISEIHFAPTENAKMNLIDEGIAPKSIHVTGNTVIDALLEVVEKTRLEPPVIPGLPDFLQPGKFEDTLKLVLITGHRRENFGKGFENIFQAILQLSQKYSNVHFVYPVHLNPNVQKQVNQVLKIEKQNLDSMTEGNLHLIKPLDYFQFVALMDKSYLILTDSGGVQEEAPSLGKPVLVMRDVTERPEAIEKGTVKMVGTERENIFKSVSELLFDKGKYEKMAKITNPYGDGKSADRISLLIKNYFT